MGLAPNALDPHVELLLRRDLSGAYPVVEGIPILLAPEMIAAKDYSYAVDKAHPKYAEAYAEMQFYEQAARQEFADLHGSESYRAVAPCAATTEAQRAAFPAPISTWLVDAPYDCAAQWDAYSHIAPVQQQRVMQLGGKGVHAVKFLIAGAAEAWNVTPMLSEARFAMRLAAEFGVADRLHCVVGIAEELPFPDDVFNIVFSGGCIHHTITSISMPEINRVLRSGGRFGAVDPWRAPLYAIGTRVFGKREANPFCRPLTAERIAPVFSAFAEARIIQHGALTRYPILALSKLGVHTPLSWVWQINRIDDAISSLAAPLRRAGSSVALLGTK
ncbi:MAG TPA: methyltransferase domain-containing protein [Longimicrobiales bacterium]|nr:methyltransferase domain-containing protein [Longimicrobiales bacterium]